MTRTCAEGRRRGPRGPGPQAPEAGSTAATRPEADAGGRPEADLSRNVYGSLGELRWSAMSKVAAAGATMFRSLRIRNYRLYFLGQIVSLTGTWMQTVALGWLVYQITGSP